LTGHVPEGGGLTGTGTGTSAVVEGARAGGFGDATGTGTGTATDTACSGEVFSVCVECAECEDEGSVSNSCCPDSFIPEDLTATVLVGTGNCCETTSVTLTYNDGYGRWVGSGPFGSCGRQVSLELWCTFEIFQWVWKLSVEFEDGCRTPFEATSQDGYACEPVEILFGNAINSLDVAGCCDGAGLIQIVVTE